MSKLLHMTSFGYGVSSDPTQLQNLAAAGQGYHVHVSNPPNEGQMVIDRAQYSESQIMHDAAELPQILMAPINHSISSVSHTWTSQEVRTAVVAGALARDIIPWIGGWS